SFRAAESEELAVMLDGDPALMRSAAAQLELLVKGGRPGLVRMAPTAGCGTGQEETPAAPEPVALFVESHLPPPRMLIFGANDFGAALIPAGRMLGYRVTLCDARPVFATQSRFDIADEAITAWPHRYLEAEAAAGRLDGRTVVCVLTHDPKFDIPLLQAALCLDLAYVRVVGSRRSHRQRIDSLLDVGVASSELARLHSPIGLDLGAV